MDWDADYRVIEMIELRKAPMSLRTIIGMIGETKFIHVVLELGEQTICDDAKAFGSGTSIAELIDQNRRGMRDVAAAEGAEMEIIEIPEPFGPEEFDAAVAAAGARSSGV